MNRQPINDGAVRRFRFTASEISKLWADRWDTLLPAAKNLGWLNVVGEESGEAIYAFYHPTFQEYFAACSIDDWDYFLPRAHEDRPVNCQGESVPTYRVFEKQWQQVILLWIGETDLSSLKNDLREKFIQRLTNFREKEEFDYYLAYCMAGICTSEFKSSKQTKGIIDQIIIWAFGYFNIDENKWKIENRDTTKQRSKLDRKFSPEFGYYTSEYEAQVNKIARQTIPFVHHNHAVIILGNVLKNNYLDISIETDIIRSMLKIDKENIVAIEYLMTIFGSSDPDWNIDERDDMYDVMDIIAEFNVESPVIIQGLIRYMDDAYGYIGISSVSTALIKFAQGDIFAITNLIRLLQESDCKDKWKAACKILSEIAKNNHGIGKYLIEIIRAPYLVDKKVYAAIALGKIEKGNTFAVSFLSDISRSSVADERINTLATEALNGIDEENFYDSVDKIFKRMQERFGYDF